MIRNIVLKTSRHSQQGMAAVEFALVASIFFFLLLGILEFGRLFYLYNTVQEVTRRAARQAVVSWTDQASTIKAQALFGGANLPAGIEIKPANITIDYLNTIDGDPIQTPPSTPADNITACVGASASCIAFVQVSINATYQPMVAGLFPFLSVPMPASTVTMPAESMGYTQ
jgi:hypothetical protein